MSLFFSFFNQNCKLNMSEFEVFDKAVTEGDPRCQFLVKSFMHSTAF